MLERRSSTIPTVAADAEAGAAKAELKALRKANAELSRRCATLAATAQRYCSLFNAIDAGFCIIEVVFDPAGTPVDYRFVEVNSAFEEQTGLKDVVGKSIRELAPGHEQHWFQIYGRVALSGEPIRFQNRASVLSRWYDAYAFRVGPPQERTVGVLFTNITARKRAEEQLRDREKQLRFITDHLPALIVHCDAETRYKFVNAAYAEQFSIDPDNVIGRKVADVIEPAVYDVVRPHIEAALGGQRVEFEEMLPYEKLGERWMHGVYLPEKAPDGRVVGFVAIVQDVTKRKNAERALVKTQQELKDYAVNLEKTVADRTAKLRETVQELEAFSYSIAHDMRAPLRAMRGFSSILEEEHANQLDSVARTYLHRISTAAHRLDQLILDILDYSKIVRDELRLAPVDLHKLVREILASYPQFDSSMVDIIVDGNIPVVLANGAALTQVLSNILTNAVKFVASGVRPRVRVRAENVWNDPAFPNGAVRLWVEDNGLGIPRHAQARLFEIFTRFEDPALYEGTGIGLAIVKKAVERMRGTIGVESEPGKGSRFWVQFHRPSGAPPSG